MCSRPHLALDVLERGILSLGVLHRWTSNRRQCQSEHRSQPSQPQPSHPRGPANSPSGYHTLLTTPSALSLRAGSLRPRPFALRRDAFCRPALAHFRPPATRARAATRPRRRREGRAGGQHRCRVRRPAPLTLYGSKLAKPGVLTCVRSLVQVVDLDGDDGSEGAAGESDTVA